LSGVLFAPAPNPGFEAGKTVPAIACSADSKQTYALYLPSNFNTSRQWPIIYVFDPGARGQLAVETVRAAAEQYGYIVVASNNSRNGPTGGSGEAADSIWRDTHQRFPIDKRRRYFAGMSGGARVATGLALNCGGCVAGVIADAAGFQLNRDVAARVKFAYFGAVGDADFNFPEFVELQEKLGEYGLRHRIRVFAGDHGWAPPEVWQEALNWMDIQAMATGALPRDEKRIEETVKQELATAAQLRSQGDVLESFRRYESVARDFGDLADVSAARAAVAELSHDKALRKAQKDERDEVLDQARLASEPSAQLQAVASDDFEPVALYRLRSQIADLKRQVAAAGDARARKALVTRRILGGLVAQAFESGQRCMEQKRFDAALKYFDLAGAGSRHPEWAHYQRALAYARMSDKKGVLAELRLAVDGGLHDLAVLEADEFQPFREQPEFQALVAELKQRP
jgi:tetratricopeptide (TPR) repeat protein